MQSAEYDLGYLSAALPILEEYILSPELYWSLAARPPAGGTPFPELTLGTLLLVLARLAARHLSGEQGAALQRLQAELDRIRSHWRVAWEAKARHGYSARLKLWRDFLEEYRSNPENNYDRYAYEVRLRAMLELLSAEVPDLAPAEVELLGGLDKLLRTALIPGDFLWGGELAGGFPRERYWYLYGRLREV